MTNVCYLFTSESVANLMYVSLSRCQLFAPSVTRTPGKVNAQCNFTSNVVAVNIISLKASSNACGNTFCFGVALKLTLIIFLSTVSIRNGSLIQKPKGCPVWQVLLNTYRTDFLLSSFFRRHRMTEIFRRNHSTQFSGTKLKEEDTDKFRL